MDASYVWARASADPDWVACKATRGAGSDANMGQTLERVAVALLILQAVGFAGVGLRRRSRTFVLAAGVVAATVLIIVSGFPADVPAPWRGAIRYAVIAAMTAFLWVAIIQEPAWLAYRLGFVHRSPEWEYDVLLSRLAREFTRRERSARELDVDARSRIQPPPVGKREALRTEAEQIVATIRLSKTPSEGWSILAYECVEILELRLQNFGVPITDEMRQKVLDANAKATAHRDQLVAAYRAKARSAFRWP